MSTTVEPTPKAPPSPPPNRLEWLFRDVLRQGLVHPLIHLDPIDSCRHACHKQGYSPGHG